MKVIVKYYLVHWVKIFEKLKLFCEKYANSLKLKTQTMLFNFMVKIMQCKFYESKLNLEDNRLEAVIVLFTSTAESTRLAGIIRR